MCGAMEVRGSLAALLEAIYRVDAGIGASDGMAERGAR